MIKKFLAGFLSLSMIVGTVLSGVTTVRAEEINKLEDGYYQSVLDITDWSETTEATTGLKVSQRACLIEMSNGTKNALQIQITGYSQYDAIYMVKQDADISEIDISKGGKIGTWTDITNYEKLKDNGYVDENLNDSFVKLTPDKGSVDETLDTATFTLNNWSDYSFDCTKKVGLVV